MKTKKLILDVIGEAVKEYGFSYTPVPKVPSVWEFTKKVGIITQTIRLYVFSEASKKVKMVKRPKAKRFTAKFFCQVFAIYCNLLLINID